MWDVFHTLPLHEFLAFVGAGLILNLAPGPDVLFATASGLQGGPRVGAAAGLGVAGGVIWHVGLAALGLSALIAALPQALITIRWAGAVYLLYLAWKSWNAGAAPAAKGAVTPGRAFLRGALTNLLNPKPILFLLAFLPQFVRPDYGPAWQQIVVLGGAFALTGAVVTAGYGFAAGLAGRAVGAHMGWLNRIAAVMFAGLAARMVWTR